MRTSFLTALVLAATFVAGAPLDTRGNNFPSFALGGNAQSGNSGNANGGGVYNDAGYWGYIYNGPYASEFA